MAYSFSRYPSSTFWIFPSSFHLAPISSSKLRSFCPSVFPSPVSVAVASLARPERFIRAAERARVPADVEPVHALGAAEHVPEDARDGRVQ
ncbi:hypothetical protein RRF57_003410 [Xylaria bambusicola]|uniref:Uncharacterized protein n=1 Tax=Xylaria bambusicola TaxID=326684 RepID=A0AAN7YWC1_9PEZI